MYLILWRHLVAVSYSSTAFLLAASLSPLPHPNPLRFTASFQAQISMTKSCFQLHRLAQVVTCIKMTNTWNPLWESTHKGRVKQRGTHGRSFTPDNYRTAHGQSRWTQAAAWNDQRKAMKIAPAQRVNDCKKRLMTSAIESPQLHRQKFGRWSELSKLKGTNRNVCFSLHGWLSSVCLKFRLTQSGYITEWLNLWGKSNGNPHRRRGRTLLFHEILFLSQQVPLQAWNRFLSQQVSGRAWPPRINSKQFHAVVVKPLGLRTFVLETDDT